MQKVKVDVDENRDTGYSTDRPTRSLVSDHNSFLRHFSGVPNLAFGRSQGCHWKWGSLYWFFYCHRNKNLQKVTHRKRNITDYGRTLLRKCDSYKEVETEEGGGGYVAHDDADCRLSVDANCEVRRWGPGISSCRWRLLWLTDRTGKPALFIWAVEVKQVTITNSRPNSIRGPYTYDVRESFFLFLDPLPSHSVTDLHYEIHAYHATSVVFVCFLGDPLPHPLNVICESSCNPRCIKREGAGPSKKCWRG